MKRFIWLGFVALVYVICSGCGETFRPIIIPNPPTFPNPAAAHSVVSINQNVTDNLTQERGSAMVIDVSGDSIVSVADCTTALCLGFAPVHAVQQAASQVLVANQFDSISKVNFSGTTMSSTTTISLPVNSAPSFVATTESSQAYVLLPGYVNPVTSLVVPSVGVINTNSNILVTTIPLSNNAGASPVAMVETLDTKKLYVADNSLPCNNPPTPGICSISAFNTVDQSSRGVVGPTGSPAVLSSPPIWLSARTDSQAVYVLEANGILAWISTISTAGPDTLTETSISVPGANIMVYDPNLNRLYIPGGQEVAIVDVSQSPPVSLAGGPIAIPTVAPGSRAAGDPCSLTGAQPLTVAAVAALPDGSRAYVGAYYEDASDNICPQATVIDVASNAIKTSIAIPGFPAYDAFCSSTRFRIMMAAAGDSTRAYLSSCDGGNVNIIDTSNDSYILNQPEPIGSRKPIGTNPLSPPQNPVFLFAGP